MRITALLTIAAIIGCINSVVVQIDLVENPQSELNAVHPVNIKDVVMIKLAENPTTGYTWVLVNREANSQALKFSKKEYFPANHQDDIFGAGGIKYYNFLAQQSGADSLDFIYCQVFAMEKFYDSETGHFDISSALAQNMPINHFNLKFDVKPEPALESAFLN
eukprot:403359551